MNNLKLKASFQILLIILTSFTVLFLNSQFVGAEEATGCCEKVGEDYCIPSTTTTQCDSGEQSSLSSCDTTSFCKLGTCYIEQQCSSNVPKATCENKGGAWFDKLPSQVPECALGCCSSGMNCMLATQEKCDSLENFEFDLGISDEASCVYQCMSEDMGCCTSQEDVNINGTTEEKSCIYTTREQCDNVVGEFNLNQYCSSLELCDCNTHNHKECGISDEDNLYWFDSCGNQEELVETCDYPNTICATDINDENGDGNIEEYICRNLNCNNIWDNPLMDAIEGEKINGESWCSYQSKTGPGLDLPGSRHYRHTCMNGEEVALPCDDYREQVCFYTDVTDPDSNTPFSFAQCKPNRWQDCYTQTSIDDCQNPDLGDCAWLADRCFPLYPPGFAPDEGRDFCSLANIETQVAWEKDVTDDEWKIVENGEALSGKFLDTANSFCRAFGDCGADYNIACKFTWAGFVRNCGDTHGKDCSEYLYYVGNCNDFNYAGIGNYIPEGDFAELQNVITNLMASGGLSGQMDFTTAVGILGVSLTSLYAIGTLGSMPIITSIATSLGGALVPGIGQSFIGGISSAISSTASLTGAAATWGGAMPIIASAFSMLALAVAAYVILSIAWELLKQYDTTDVNTYCGQWNVPKGSDDCEKCQTPMSEGGLLPDKNGKIIKGYECGEYTCKTLGTGCVFIPDTAEGSVCLESSNIKPPIIKPDFDALNVTCSSGDCTINDKGIYGYVIEGTIKEFSVISFGIKTIDELGDSLLARCSYSDGEEFDINNPAYSESFGLAAFNHNLTLYTLKPGQEYQYHIKCTNAVSDAESIGDYIIKFKINSEPDMTPPIILEFNPENDGYVANNSENINFEATISELVSDKSGGAGCKWDTENIPFSEMKNEMICSAPASNTEQQKCMGSLSGLILGENTFYVACKDNSGNENIPTAYTLIKTILLKIESIDAISDYCKTDINNNITCYTKQITLKAVTSGGAESGKATCYYSNTCDTEGCVIDQFYNTDNSVHLQPNLTISNGMNILYVRCLDVAKNLATDSININSDIDESAPEIVSITKDTKYGDRLKIIVKDDNEVTCKYLGEKFSFNDINAKDMYKAGKEFYADWGLDVYYIICQDEYDNEMKLNVVYV